MQAIKQFFKTHPHAWWGAYLPVYLAMFFTIEHFTGGSLSFACTLFARL